MHPIPFIADSAADAVAQIRAQLGPEAVVLNVRKLPALGLARLWQNPRIEVLAYKPELTTPAPDVSATDSLAELRQELEEIRRQVGGETREVVGLNSRVGCAPNDKFLLQSSDNFVASPDPRSRSLETQARPWRVGALLESTGLLPLYAQRVVDELQWGRADGPPAALTEELSMARAILARLWREARPAGQEARRPHVMIGAPGAGKTTALCKWLAQSVLVEGMSAHVWRLDGATANTAEALDVYCEILGVPNERSWNEAGAQGCGAGISFIDLPGVDWREPAAVRGLKELLRGFGAPRVHLVLNAAYESPLLLAQARAFAELSIEDVIVTHLDEETRWGKVWNIVLGTNYSVRSLCNGQNVPGNFLAATPDILWARQFAT